jgi:hypothetical protein
MNAFSKSNSTPTIPICIPQCVTCNSPPFPLLIYYSNFLQGFIRKEPSQKHSDFISSTFFKAFNQKFEAPSIAAVQHILEAQTPDISVLETQQVKAIEAINSSKPFAVIHGPPGTGKTHVIAEALRLRNPDHYRKSNPKDITLIVTMSNHAAINVTYTLYKSGITGFSLVISNHTFDILITSGSKELQELLDNKLIWQPEDIQEQSRQIGHDANRAQKNSIRKVNILVMTVLPFTFILTQVWIPLFPNRQVSLAERNHQYWRSYP